MPSSLKRKKTKVIDSRKLLKKACLCCDKLFLSFKSQNKKFCSQNCYHKSTRGKTPNWKNPKLRGENITKGKVGCKYPREFIERRKGKGNPHWKGNKVKPRSLHSWITDNFKKPEFCEICKIKKGHDWSNKNHKYARKRKDWQWICRRCHIHYDIKHNRNVENKNR